MSPSYGKKDYPASDNNFNCNGIIAPDRRYNPHAYEVRYNYQNIWATAKNLKKGQGRAVAEGSRSAAADSPGAARIRITAMARTPDGTESACALFSALPFSAAGRLTCDLSQGLSPLSDVLYPTAILPTDYDAFGEILAQTG